MRIIGVLSCLLVMFCGCGADKPAEKEQKITPPVQQTTQTGAKPAANTVTAPPVDAQWTIFCYEIAGPGHVEQINMMKTQLEQVSGMSTWHAIHSDEKSALYYGYYKTRNGTDILADKKKVTQIRDARGDTIFANAVPVMLDAPDPASPPEWNLLNAKGYWSVEVATFQGDARRKEAAVEMVREWRDRKIDAYYFHGENVSSVCVGAFPESAIKQQENDRGGTIDPNQPMMVINGDLPEYMRRAIQTNTVDRDGNHVKVFVQKVEVADPAMLDVFKQFPVHLHNYNEEFVGFKDATGKPVQSPKPCGIVAIPHKDPAITPGNRANQPDLINPGTAQPQPGGRLRRIGEQ